MFGSKGVRLFRLAGAAKTVRQGSSLAGSKSIGNAGRLGAAVAVGAAAYAGYRLFDGKMPAMLPAVEARWGSSSTGTYQPNVISQKKDEGVFLWIHLKPTADHKACGKIVAQLQKHVDALSPPDSRDESDEIWAGVGFGPDMYSKLAGKTEKNYTMCDRKGALGGMPATGGDIFIQAKSNHHSKLFELVQRIVYALPEGSIESFEDIYGWDYQFGRDLSGHIDGTANPADDESRIEHAIEPGSGGSYCITQKWIHNHPVIRSSKSDAWVGRSQPDGTELRRKTTESHVARMVGSTDFECKKKFEIVRQSMPYGTFSGENGLLFIAFSKTPESFNYQLDRMVGSEDGHCDDIMRLTTCVKGNYWYFPSVEQLSKIARL